MLNSLLEASSPIGEHLLYALMGFIITFIGIIILIFFVWLYGKVSKILRTKKSVQNNEPKEADTKIQKEEDGISMEIRLAIIAAIAAYYDGEGSACEFKVKRIKRI